MIVLSLILLLVSGCFAPSAPARSSRAVHGGQHAVMAGASLQGWVEGLVMGVRDNDTGVTVIFLNTYSQPDGLAPGVWHTIDVTPLGVPRDVLAVFLSGILILTHGWTPETCNITLAFRAPGAATLAGNYIFQALEAAILGGQRSNAAAIIPVKGGKFEMQWNQSSLREKRYPEVCAYGANILLSAYIRKGVTVYLEPIL